MALKRNDVRLPGGWIGGIFGALGALPLLPIAAGIATRLAARPFLPGMELKHGDVKLATYAEAGVLLLVIPLAAFVFGIIVPRFLDKKVGSVRLSFEWCAVGFAASFFLAQRGTRPKYCILAGLFLAIGICAVISAFHRSYRIRRLFSRKGRRAAILVCLAGSSLDLARRASTTQHSVLIQGLLSELLLAGLVLLVLTVLICLLASPRPDRQLRRLGDTAWIAITVAAIAIAFPSIPPGVLALGILLPAISMVSTSSAGSAVTTSIALSLLLGVCGWKIVRPQVVWFDSFEDGHSLAPAQKYLKGARPYRDLIPIHGWGTDGGVDAFVFRYAGATLETYFVRRAIWASAAIVLLWWVCGIALGSAYWGSAAFLFALSICPTPIERQALAFAALLLLCLSVRKQKRSLVVAAGVVASAEIFYSLDYGLIVAIGGSCGFLLLSLADGASGERLMVRLADCGAFLGGLLIGSLPFLLLLTFQGAVSGFFHVSFVETPRWVEDAWGWPAPSVWKTLVSQTSLGDLVNVLANRGSPLFVLLLMAAIGATLLVRRGSRRLDSVDRAALMSFAVAAVAMRVVLGRADYIHAERYGVFAALPAAWLLLRACRAADPGWPLAVLTGAALAIGIHPVRALENELGQVENAATQTQIAHGALAPRSGTALLFSDQASALRAVSSYMDSALETGETFFDFANQPGLYFVADRLIPIRYCSVAQYESAERQAEVIDELEKRKPPVAILPAGLYGALDGVSNAERAPAVDAYLSAHYKLDREVGGYFMARRRPEAREAQP